MSEFTRDERMPDSASDILPSQFVSSPESLRRKTGPRSAKGEPKVTFSTGDQELDAQANLEEIAAVKPENAFDGVEFTGDLAADLKWLAEQDNVAPHMSDSARAYYGDELLRMVAIDEASRADWRVGAERGLELSDLTREPYYNRSPEDQEDTTEPPARYPMITKAIIEFASDAFSTMLSDPQVAKVESYAAEAPAPQAPGPAGGAQPPSQDDRLQRLSDFMSYTIASADMNWQGDTDKLLHHVAACGLAWRKRIPVDSFNLRQSSEFITAFDVIVNNCTSNINDTPRIAHRLTYYPHEIRQRVAKGYFHDVDRDVFQSNDMHNPVEFYEIHTWLDLDDDNIDEPWIVTVQMSSRKIVRLVTGFSVEDIHFSENGSPSFDQQKYFADYHFVPNFNGTFHSLGFGHLLSRLNATVDDLVNTILEIAKNNAANSGVLGRIGSGLPESIYMRRNELQIIPTDGQELAHNLVLFPTKEVPQTLFTVLGLFVDTGNALASSVDLKDAPANMPATTAMAIVEQGSKIHSSIFRRLWRSMTAEFRLVYDQMRRSSRNMRGDMTFTQAGREQQISPSDFQDIPLITVNADPNITTSAHKAALASYYQSLAADPFTNQVALRQRMHALMRVPNAAELIQPPQGPPPADQARLIEAQVRKDELELKRVEMLAKLQESDQKAKLTAAQAAHQVILALTELAKLRTGDALKPDMPTQSGQPGEGGEGNNRMTEPPSEGDALKNENAVREAYQLLVQMVGAGQHAGIFESGSPVGSAAPGNADRR